MGAGGCGVAALNTGRRFVGMEIDEEYYRIAEERIFKAHQSTEIRGSVNNRMYIDNLNVEKIEYLRGTLNYEEQ